MMLVEPVNVGTLWKVLVGVATAAVATASFLGSVDKRIEAKANAVEVQTLKSQLNQMASDITTIRLILCDGKPADSYCRTR